MKLRRDEQKAIHTKLGLEIEAIRIWAIKVLCDPQYQAATTKKDLAFLKKVDNTLGEMKCKMDTKTVASLGILYYGNSPIVEPIVEQAREGISGTALRITGGCQH